MSLTVLQAAKLAAEKMSLADLTELSAHLRSLVESRARNELRHGDLVECTFRGGETIRFRVERMNPKTISGREVGGRGRNCRAPAALCRLVGADRPAAPAPAMVPPAAPSRAPALEDAEFGAF